MTWIRGRGLVAALTVGLLTVACAEPSTPTTKATPARSFTPAVSSSPMKQVVPSASTREVSPSAVAGGETPASPAQTLSVQEAALLDIIRSDARFACAPRRVDLPPAATAGIECAPDTDLVARVGAYQFPTDRDAAKVYFDRLAEYGVLPLSGDCAAGQPGDSAWTPGDGVLQPDDPAAIVVRGELYVTHRAGCFPNENGIANYRVTCGRGISIGILGANGNLAALSEWAEMHVIGEESVDTPSPPGICHGSGSSP
jgi:hypothetical protein